MRIAIIGSGISGLSCAYELGKHHQVVVYEKNDYFGGHTRTREIQYDGQSISVDTGFIVFNYKNYPLLTKLFSDLGVPIQASNMSFGCTLNKGEFEWSGRNLLGVFAQKSNLFKPKFYKFLSEIALFNRQALQLVSSQATGFQATMGEFLADLKLSKEFLDWYLLPMAGAIWSCPPEMIKEFPAKSFLMFFYNHGLLTVTQQPQWYSVVGGAKTYVEKIIALSRAQFRKKFGVKKVIRQGETNYIIDEQNNREAYDKIIFACHAPTTLQLIDNPDHSELDALQKFKYQPNTVILHCDTAQMPTRKAAWASWIYARNTQNKQVQSDISVTYWMNNLQKHIPKNKLLFVTLNPAYPIDPKKIFDSTVLDHPVFDLDSLACQNKIELIQGHKNCYYAGAWTGNGFHEDGIRSAYHVVKLIADNKTNLLLDEK